MSQRGEVEKGRVRRSWHIQSKIEIPAIPQERRTERDKPRRFPLPTADVFIADIYYQCTRKQGKCNCSTEVIRFGFQVIRRRHLSYAGKRVSLSMRRTRHATGTLLSLDATKVIGDPYFTYFRGLVALEMPTADVPPSKVNRDPPFYTCSSLLVRQSRRKPG